ncbi:MAG: polysaccharide deacetylase family protein [Reichenbachiella sp.]|uniref:polysaccharide deacetylase family protein n=1 Tax=Reichenbachiella sp. TaxID=2184521 RepID=UPI002965F034|nr:polysaccharide deacetylase family protein [Reichenbachiella sp.]MDW3208382.1 polysaccharide deacetylase family protein [Reichenbachiella sp.]
MKHFVFFLTILVACSFELKSQSKQVCLSVDDLTVVSYGINDTSFTYGITRNLIKTFGKYQIPAIGFVNESKVYTNDTLDASKMKHLEMWASNGYDLGNHTFAHSSYHKTPFDEYAAGILKGELVTRPLLEQYGKEIKYFRHPYLQVGLTQSAYDSLNQFLTKHDYIVAPVSIDNSDWRFAKAYSDAYKNGDAPLMKKIGEAYVDYMEQVLMYYEHQSLALFGRVIAQTLLTHASYLNAEYLDDVMQKYVEHGYQFISQDEAMEDPAYQTAVTYFDNWGISWIDRWNLSQGKSRDIFKDEPKVPAFIK